MSGEVGGRDTLWRTSMQNCMASGPLLRFRSGSTGGADAPPAVLDNSGGPSTNSTCLVGQSVRNVLGQVTVLLWPKASFSVACRPAPLDRVM